MSKEGGLVYIQVYIADTLAHVWKTGEPLETFGARVMLWLLSGEEDPVGTLPDDVGLWAQWLKIDADAMRVHYDRITRGWRRDENGRWIVRRVVEQGETMAAASERGRKAANARYRKKKGGACRRTANAMRTQCPPSPSPTPSPTPAPALIQAPQPPTQSADMVTSGQELWDEIQTFWKAYPRKEGHQAFVRAWARLRPPLPECLAALDWQRHTRQWTKNGGEFIPKPVTYIENGCWKDQPIESEVQINEPVGYAGMREVFKDLKGEEQDG
ncbi:MAG: hypothetical protein KKH61_21605 [Gammaproteobacteria bacterium]|nr:hypothetical protein [Gammaproteobacteria bacterium]